jgi:WD40 repeat protein
MHASDSATTRASGGFYVTGGTLPVDTGSYVHRAADNELYESLLARKFCYILTSRQVGKSSLMVRTAARLREAGVAVGVADLTAIGRNLTPEQWYAGLLARIGQQLDVEDELEDFWTDHRSVGPLLRWVEAMRSVVLVRRSAPVVIFIDEIDVVQSLGFSTDEFFAAIRECHNRRAEEPEMNRLTFCLIGVATPTDLIEDRRLTPFNIGSRIELTDLAEEDAAPLSAGMGGGGETGRRLLRRVFHWTNGHPYLTQKLCAAVAADASATSTADVDRVCEDLFLADLARDVDDNLVYVRERMLRSEVDRATLLDAYGKVHAGKQVRFDDGDRVITVLLLSGIAANGNGQLHPRNRVYERAFDRTWIRENMPDAELRRQRAAVRRGMFRVAGIAVAVVVVVGGLAVFARYQTTVARAAKEETTRLLAESQAETGRVMLRDGDLKGLLHLAQARATADEMPALASELAEEWTLWHWQLDGRLVQVFGQDSEVTAMGFSPDGSLFITGSADGIAQLWRTDTGEPHGAPLVHGSRIGHDPRWWHMSPTYTLVCFNRDSTLVALGGEDGTITVWDTATTEEHLASFRPGDGPVNQMTFDPDGFLVAYVDMPDRGKALWRWDMRDGSASLSGAPVADPERTLMQGILLPDSSALFAMSYNGLGLVDTQTGDEAWRTDHYGWLSSATWSRTRIATAYTLSVTPTGVGAPSGSVQVFDWHGTPIYELAPSRETGRVQVDATPDGRSLLTVTEKGLRLWDFATGTPYGDPIAHDGWVMYRAFNADSTLLAGASGSTVYVWDLDTGDLVVDPIRYPHPVKGLIFHPADPHVLAVQSVDRSARLWDVGPPSDYVTLATFEGEAQADHFTKGMAAFSPTQQTFCVITHERSPKACAHRHLR